MLRTVQAHENKEHQVRHELVNNLNYELIEEVSVGKYHVSCTDTAREQLQSHPFVYSVIDDEASAEYNNASKP